MKKFNLIIIILFQIIFTSCLDNTDKDEPFYIAEFKTFFIVIDGKSYEQDVFGNEIYGTVPFKTDRTNLVAVFELAEGATATINGIPQISGETVNNFTDTVEYKVVSKDGKRENMVTVDITNAKNTEATLISLTIGGYSCDINQADKTATLTVPAGTSLTNIFVEYEISENATLEYGPGYIMNNTLQNVSYDDMDLEVRAEDYYKFYTTYDYIIIYE